MSRISLFHLTPLRRLPSIEETGLRTRADLASLLGDPSGLDRAAPGTFANGKRVSAWHSLDFARTQVDQLGAGLVTFTVDPAKTLAAPASARVEAEAEADFASYWRTARSLQAWMANGPVPDDLEVHQNVPVRSKHVAIMAPLVDDAHLGVYNPLVAPLVDADRLAAKALMHLLLVACDGKFDSPEFAAACACAWRDDADPASLIRELVEVDPDKIVSAVLAEHQVIAPDAVAGLQAVLDDTRAWSRERDIEAGQGLLERSGEVLDRLERPRP